MKVKYLFLVISLLCISKLNAQVGTWVAIEGEKRILKKLKVEASFQIREADYTKPIDKFLFDAGLVANLPEGFGASVFYRYSGTFKTKRDFYEPAHRFYGNITYERQIDKIVEIQYRFRYQNQFKDTEGIFGSDKSYIRNKLEVSYLIPKSKFKPFVSADFFYQLGYDFDQVRIKLGSSYKINKKQKVSLAIFDDKEINVGNANSFAFDLTYGYKF